MTGCIQCKFLNQPSHRQKCKSGCRPVVMKMQTALENIKATDLQNYLERSYVRRPVAKRLAEQVTDLGVAEIVLPNVSNEQRLLDEFGRLGLDARIVQRLEIAFDPG